MAATIHHITLRRRLWVVRLTVPPDVQCVIGKKIFSKSTGERSEARAAVKAEAIISGWKRQIEEARAALLRSPGALISETKMAQLKLAWKDRETDEIAEAMMALVRSGLVKSDGRRAYYASQEPWERREPESELEELAADHPKIKALLDVITEERTRFGEHTATWLGTLKTMKARQKDQYARDVALFDPGETLFVEDVKWLSVQTWIEGRSEAGDAIKTIQRRLSALRSYWGWLQRSGHAPRETTPWTGHTIPGGSPSARCQSAP